MKGTSLFTLLFLLIATSWHSSFCCDHGTDDKMDIYNNDPIAWDIEQVEYSSSRSQELQRHHQNRALVRDNSNNNIDAFSSIDHNNHKRCGTKHPTIESINESVMIVNKWKSSNQYRLYQNEVTTLNALVIEVPTYFHVMTDGVNGNISDEIIQSQFTVLNDAFSTAGFTFRLLNITRTNNSSWYNSITDQLEMKRTLRVGDASTLNIYSLNSNGNFVGYAEYPSKYQSNRINDGVVIDVNTVPGGTYTYYNAGKSLVHEVGHWLGLFHTFEAEDGYSGFFPRLNSFLVRFGIRNGCSKVTRGDVIADTPKQRSGTYGCPSRRNSCILSPGDDPIHNYMDYSFDECLFEFTPDQRDRMIAMWYEYRAPV